MKLFFTILFLIMIPNVHADMWYILDKDENVVSKQNGPVKQDISKDGFFVIQSNQDVELSKAVYRNKKIIERQKTKSDSDIDKKSDDDKSSAITKLKALGFTEDEIKLILGR